MPSPPPSDFCRSTTPIMVATTIRWMTIMTVCMGPPRSMLEFFARCHIGTRAPVHTSTQLEGLVAAPCSARDERRKSVQETVLFEDLQISDDILDVLRVAQPTIGHAVALHLRLRILDVGAQIILVPNEIGASHRIGISEIVKRCRFAPNDALQAWSQRIRTLRMACRAGRIVAVLLRKHRGALDEQVVRVPGLQIAVHHARLRV